MAYGEIIDQKMLKIVRVAAVSVDSTTGDWNDNLKKITEWIKQAADSGVEKKQEWFLAFGLIVSLVWLYLEMLRLLSKLRSR